MQSRHLPDTRLTKEVSSIVGEIPGFAERLRRVFRKHLGGVLHPIAFERIGSPLRLPLRFAVHDKGASPDSKARATGLRQDDAHVGMNRKIDAGCLDVASLRVRLSNRTDDAVTDDVIEAEIHEIDAPQGQMEGQRHQPSQPLRRDHVDGVELFDRQPLTELVRQWVDEQIIDRIR